MKLSTFAYIFISLFLIAFLLAKATNASNVEFSWLPNNDQNLKGYTIHYGKDSRYYYTFVDVGKPEIIDGRVVAIIPDVPDTEDLYFTVTAENTEGLHSEFSNEVLLSALEENKPIPPQNFMVSLVTTTFTWDPSTDIDLYGYAIYCSPTQGKTSNHELWQKVSKDSIIDNKVTYTWEGFPSGTHYCVSVTLAMYDGVKVSSVFSTEIMVTAPMEAPPAPQNFMFGRRF